MVIIAPDAAIVSSASSNASDDSDMSDDSDSDYDSDEEEDDEEVGEFLLKDKCVYVYTCMRMRATYDDRPLSPT